jgi:hypothetical protein
VIADPDIETTIDLLKERGVDDQDAWWSLGQRSPVAAPGASAECGWSRVRWYMARWSSRPPVVAWEEKAAMPPQ